MNFFNINYLGCDVFVGESNNHSVFWCVVFVLLLKDQTLPGIVVSLTLLTKIKENLKNYLSKNL